MGDIAGTVVTFDALHTNRKRLETLVVEKQADCLMQVKDNTPALLESLVQAFDNKADQRRISEDLAYGHGRIETRILEMIPISPLETQWPHTHVACRVERHVEKLRRGEVVERTHDQSIYVGTFAIDTCTPERVQQFARGHWGIENGLHHPKDRSMDEDRCTASETGIGRVVSCIRGLVALVSRRTKESLAVIRRRFAGKPHLLINLLASTTLANWEQRCKPYKTA